MPPLRRDAAGKEAEVDETALEMDEDTAEDRFDQRARASRVTPKV